MKSEEALTHQMSVKNQTGFWLGASGGFVFSLVCWGTDAIGLFEAHSYLPWIKFLVGIVTMSLVAGLCGYFVSRFERLWTSMLAWLLWGLFAAWYASIIPYKLQEKIITGINPLLKGQIDYPNPSGQSGLIFVSILAAIVLTSLIGFFYIQALEQTWMRLYVGPMIFNLVIWFLFFSLLGVVTDNVYNQPMRNSIQATHDTIETIKQDGAIFERPSEAAQKHLFAFKPHLNLIQRPYMLVVKTYDPRLETFQVLVDFDGFWLNCTVSLGTVVVCK